MARVTGVLEGPYHYGHFGGADYRLTVLALDDERWVPADDWCGER